MTAKKVLCDFCMARLTSSLDQVGCRGQSCIIPILSENNLVVVHETLLKNVCECCLPRCRSTSHIDHAGVIIISHQQELLVGSWSLNYSEIT